MCQCSEALLGTANALSCLPVATNAVDAAPVPADWAFLVSFLESSSVTSTDIREHTHKDPVLSKFYISAKNIGLLRT